MKWAIVLSLAIAAAGSGCCWRPAWCNQQQTYAQPVYAQQQVYAQPCQPVCTPQPNCCGSTY